MRSNHGQLISDLFCCCAAQMTVRLFSPLRSCLILSCATISHKKRQLCGCHHLSTTGGVKGVHHTRHTTHNNRSFNCIRPLPVSLLAVPARLSVYYLPASLVCVTIFPFSLSDLACLICLFILCGGALCCRRRWLEGRS